MWVFCLQTTTKSGLHFITIEMTPITCSYLKDVIDNWFYDI